MRRYASAVLILLVLIGGLVGAQSGSPTATTSETPVTLGPVNKVTPTATPIPPEDPRPAVCAAPYQTGFAPHLIRPGERMADLMVGVLNLTVTQVMALNCLDDASSLPVGAVIWLPQANPLTVAPTLDSNPNVDEVRIISLSASSPTVPNQASVTFIWQAVGTAAYFYACPPDPNSACPRPANAQPVPLTYTTPAISGFRYAGTMRYRLEVVDGAAQATRDVTLSVICSQQNLGQYSGLTPCPDEPLRSLTGAIQPFQDGLMLWFSDTHQIWVLTDSDQRVQVFDDLYQEGDPDPADKAPSGLFTPKRGFGRVWKLSGAQNPLGWATAQESGVDIARQPAGKVSYTTYLQPQGGAIYAVTILPGEDSGWWVELSN
jgi:hypothetical protein